MRSQVNARSQFPPQFRLSACSACSACSAWPAVAFAVAVSVCSVCAVIPLRAQQPEKLGTISFPNSGNAAAQAPFLAGMKLYYSFEYERAAAAFRDAQKADPSFALAYWGEALTHTHQVWNEQNLPAARAALAKLAPTPAGRRAKAKTPREQLYMDVAEALYGEGTKARRDTLFTEAAERVSRANPADDETRVLHALGLLGLNQGVREFTSYMKAGAIAEEVLRRNPDHPAAAHFVIHAFDDPVHAPLGLWAARLYSKIAPAAPHAQHMTSHIFVAMGMWDDVISQNVIAAHGQSHILQAGHYTWWLCYGYMQAGQYARARDQLETMRANFGKEQRRGEGPALAFMRAHYVIDGERWGDPVVSWQLTVASAAVAALATDSFTLGLAALKRGDVPAAARAAANLMNASAAATGDTRVTVELLGKQLRASIASAAGRHADAIALARETAVTEETLPYEFGPPQFVKPTHELLGEILLAAGKPADAQVAFNRSLARMPGRSRSLVGLARAASAAGDAPTAASALAQLKANWHAADKNLPELAELAKLSASSSR